MILKHIGNRKSRKAQAEIFGLAIVMVVLVFSLLIILRLTMKPSGTSFNLKEEVKKNTIGGAFVDALLKTTVPECNGYSIQELIEDYVSYDEGQRLISCGSDDSGHFKDVVEEIVTKYFNEKGWYYKLTITTDTQQEPILELESEEKCKSGSYKTFPTYLKTLFGQEITIKLKLCLGK